MSWRWKVGLPVLGAALLSLFDLLCVTRAVWDSARVKASAVTAAVLTLDGKLVADVQAPSGTWRVSAPRLPAGGSVFARVGRATGPLPPDATPVRLLCRSEWTDSYSTAPYFEEEHAIWVPDPAAAITQVILFSHQGRETVALRVHILLPHDWSVPDPWWAAALTPLTIGVDAMFAPAHLFLWAAGDGHQSNCPLAWLLP